MDIVISRHAKKRIKDRNVTIKEVEKVIYNPDYQEPSIKNRVNCFKFINGRHIRITHTEGLIITVTIRKKPFRRV